MSNALSDLVARGESASAGYDAYNRGTRAGRIMGADRAIDFSNLTLQQVQAMQHLPSNDPNRLFAVGKYQLIPGTMDAAAVALNLDPHQKFTPALQEQIFSGYLIVDKRPQIHAYITGESNDLEAAQMAMAQEWRSIADPRTNLSYAAPHHHGINPNHASITATESAAALSQMRSEYQADIARGMTPDEAWKAVTHPTASHEQAGPDHASRSHAAHGAHVLAQGAHGQAVHDLQARLANLGYLDTKGVDGDFGIHTRHAVERFQHDQHLVVDGKVGPLTQQAMNAALQRHSAARDLTSPQHPDHTLFEQALVGVHALDAQQGGATEQQRLNLAAALTVEAKREGFTRIDQVALGDDGSRIYIAQNPTSPMEMMKFGSVDTVTAAHTPMAQSSATAASMPTPAQTPPTATQPSHPSPANTVAI